MGLASAGPIFASRENVKLAHDSHGARDYQRDPTRRLANRSTAAKKKHLYESSTVLRPLADMCYHLMSTCSLSIMKRYVARNTGIM